VNEQSEVVNVHTYIRTFITCTSRQAQRPESEVQAAEM